MYLIAGKAATIELMVFKAMPLMVLNDLSTTAFSVVNNISHEVEKDCFTETTKLPVICEKQSFYITFIAPRMLIEVLELQNY